MEIVIREGTYYSQADEAAFYARLHSLTCVKSIVGDPQGLHVSFKRRPSATQLRELIALLFRYNLDMTPLAALRTAENKTWFDKPGMFWHARVFASHRRRTA